MRKIFLTTILSFCPMVSWAQSIETGQLGAAQAFDAGVIDSRSGGLDAALWQGTSAKIAVGVPPEGADASYDQLRLKAVMKLGDKAALENIASRNPDIARDPGVRADLALASGDIAGACTVGDNITEGKGRPVWVKLRAFCHIDRGEESAAELAAELLQETGHEDAIFYDLMKVLTGASKELPNIDNINEPLLVAMAKKAAGSAGVSENSVDVLDSNVTFPRFAKLFEADIAIIPAEFQAETNVKLFARAAIERRDVGTLQGLYNAMEDGPEKSRIALVSDALGNGFNLGTLGKDIEGRLEGEGSEKRRAIRDTFIAVALGSRLSGEAGIALEGAGNGIGGAAKAGDLLALMSAARAGSRAETALRAAIIIEKSPLNDRSLAGVIEALRIADLPQFAGRLAAEDFLSRL